MGDPKHYRKKYETPLHPWNKTAIETERVLVNDFGLKNKQEILIANSFLRRYKIIAKRLIADKTTQGITEKSQIIGKLQKYGFLSQEAELDEILGLGLKDVLERRLQSQIVRRGLARSMKQARQFITHRHILVGAKEITSPSYLVSKAEESVLSFKIQSALSGEDHPERVKLVVDPAVEKRKMDRKNAAAQAQARGQGQGRGRKQEHKRPAMRAPGKGGAATTKVKE